LNVKKQNQYVEIKLLKLEKHVMIEEIIEQLTAKITAQ
jgi:hypothetical protein